MENLLSYALNPSSSDESDNGLDLKIDLTMNLKMNVMTSLVRLKNVF